MSASQHLRRFLAFLVAFGLLASGEISRKVLADETASEETKEQRDQRMAWWRDARFGMFIHWGLYAVPAGTWEGKPVRGIGEWIMLINKIPVKDYAKLPAQFNPVKFNADEWVSLAKKAGMKYIVITAKHHEGFAMFPSKASPYNIHDATPFKRDPLKELAEACKKHGIKLGFYYSQAQDWHHPGGAAMRGHWDPAQDGDMTEYIRNIAVPQVREILSNYGPIAVLWWDTPVDMTKERADLLRPLLKLQPGIITNNRLGGGYAGDTETPEQFVPPTGYPGRDWETCMTINDTWGFKSYDKNWKSTETLVRQLVESASKGGNYLLNVGPTAEGVIPEASVDRLVAIGKWMDVNGESIYGTSASPFKRLAWGRCTQKPGKLYLHVFNWPKGQLKVPGLKNAVNKAYLLSDAARTALPVSANEEGVAIEVPSTAPDAIDTVVVLEIDGAPEISPFVPTQDDNGVVELLAMDAAIHGDTAKYEMEYGRDNIGFWSNPKDWVSWDFVVKEAGDFDLQVMLACDEAAAGSEYAVSVADQTFQAKVPSTGGWGKFIAPTSKNGKLGTVRIGAPGRYTLSVKPTSMPGAAVMNLHKIILNPVKP